MSERGSRKRRESSLALPASQRLRVGTPPSPLAEYRRMPDSVKTEYLTLRAYSGVGQLRKWEREEIARLSMFEGGLQASPQRGDDGLYYLVATHGNYAKGVFVPDWVLEKFKGGVYFVTFTEAGGSTMSVDMVLVEFYTAVYGAPFVRAMFEAYKRGSYMSEEELAAILRAKSFSEDVIDAVVDYHTREKFNDDMKIEVFDGLLNPPYDYILTGRPAESSVVVTAAEANRAESWGQWLRTLGGMWRPPGVDFFVVRDGEDPGTLEGRLERLYGRRTFPGGKGGIRSVDDMSFTIPLTIYTVDGEGERLPMEGGESHIAPIPTEEAAYRATLSGLLTNIVGRQPGGIVREPVYLLITSCKGEHEGAIRGQPTMRDVQSDLYRTVRGVRGSYLAERALGGQ